MAKVRFSHLDDFVLKDDGKVGIGTSLPSTRVEVIGTVRAANIKSSSGITTFVSVDGYVNQNMEYSDNVTIDSGESGTLSGEIVVGAGLTMTVGTGVTSGQGRINSLKVSNTFTPPIGGTDDRPTAPQPGALYYNKDFRTIEYWDGNFWRQVDNTTTRGRGFWIGGYDPQSLIIDYVNIQTQGNATNFGDLLSTTVGTGNNGSMCCGNEIRGVIGGGNGPSGQCPYVQYITTASKGNAINFGNLFQTRFRGSGLSSSTRGLFGAGRTPSAVNTVDYVEIMTLGNALDFGDLVNATRTPASVSSPTRGLFAGGHTGTQISAVNIASKGNATRFGEDMFDGGYTHGGGSTGVRGIWAGGYSIAGGAPYPINRHTRSIRGVTIASDGNAVEFGELKRSSGLTYVAGLSDRTRACWGGGYVLSPTADLNTIEYFQMNSSGNAMDFGDLTQSRSLLGSLSDSHGGLGGF